MPSAGYSPEVASVVHEERIYKWGPVTKPGPHPRSLHQDKKVQARYILNSERFQDLAPREVYATPLDGNPFSEAQFQTMNYRPDYPKYFGSQPDAPFGLVISLNGTI